MGRIRGGWNASLRGAVPVRHSWQRNYEPTGGDDVVHVAIGDVSDLMLTMDREALDTLAAALAAVRTEWDERGRSQ